MQLKFDFNFDDMGKFNLELVREFYANWFLNTQANSVKIREIIVKLLTKALNCILSTP